MATPTGPNGTAAGWVLVAAAVSMGLFAGTFYTFTSSVMAGLAQADDRTFVEAMQEINDGLGPAFIVAFLGPFPLTVAAALLQRRLGPGDAFGWIIAALALYVVVFAVTFGVHAPLNAELADAGDPDRIADLAAVRERFEGPWVAWNVVRSVGSTLALGCLAWSLVLHGRRSL